MYSIRTLPTFLACLAGSVHYLNSFTWKVHVYKCSLLSTSYTRTPVPSLLWSKEMQFTSNALLLDFNVYDCNCPSFRPLKPPLLQRHVNHKLHPIKSPLHQGHVNHKWALLEIINIHTCICLLICAVWKDDLSSWTINMHHYQLWDLLYSLCIH